MPALCRAHDIAAIAFDRGKFGAPLDADAADAGDLPNYITAPRPHRLRFSELVLLRGGAGSIDIDGHSFELRAGRRAMSLPCWRPRMSLLKTALLLAALVLVSAARADSVSTRELQVRELAPGVYPIRHPDPTDDFPDVNTTVVIGSQAVLVVDTGYLPSTAQADIARIRVWTDKPVRYVVNTHWHNDHVGGNHSYVQAFAGATVSACGRWSTQ